jgi:hypothetical protein
MVLHASGRGIYVGVRLMRKEHKRCQSLQLAPTFAHFM